MDDDKLLATIFAGDLKELMVISYIVLGNNQVTNRFIERKFKCRYRPGRRYMRSIFSLG